MDLVSLNFLEMMRRSEELAQMIRAQREAGRSKGPADDIAEACLQETGLPFSIVRQSSPEILSALLHEGSNFYGRALILADLLLLESEFNEEEGDRAGMVRAQLQAFCLFGESLAALATNEQAAFRQKMKLLAERLRDAGDDPYLKRKLTQFGY
jgi:hypothetical protein